MANRVLGFFVTVYQTERLAGYLEGTTVIAGAPDSPVQRLVQLLGKDLNYPGTAFPSSPPVRWGWSDSAGNWRFDNLDPSLQYHVVAYDHTGVYDPIIKMNLIPSVEA